MARSRTHRRWMPLAACVILGLIALPLAGGTGRVGAQEEVEIGIVDFAFEPAELEIPIGTTVTWINQGAAPHTVTADDGAFDSETLDPGAGFQLVFDVAGTFTYHCEFHPDMTATIVVTEGGAAPDESDEEPTETTPGPESDGGDEQEESDAAGETAAVGVRNLGAIED